MRDEGMWMVVAIVIGVIVIAVSIGFSLGRSAVAHDCRTLGAFADGETVYVCSERKP